MQEKIRLRNSSGSGKDSKKKKRKKEVVAAVPSKVLILVGKNTQLIRDYVLNELKDEHNLNIQRVSML